MTSCRRRRRLLLSSSSAARPRSPLMILLPTWPPAGPSREEAAAPPSKKRKKKKTTVACTTIQKKKKKNNKEKFGLKKCSVSFRFQYFRFIFASSSKREPRLSQKNFQAPIRYPNNNTPGTTYKAMIIKHINPKRNAETHSGRGGGILESQSLIVSVEGDKIDLPFSKYSGFSHSLAPYIPYFALPHSGAPPPASPCLTCTV